MSTLPVGSGYRAAKIISVPPCNPATPTYLAGSGYKAAKKLRLKIQFLAAKIVTLEDTTRKLETENKSLKQNQISNFRAHKREVADLEQKHKLEVADLEQRLSEAQSTMSLIEEALSFGAFANDTLTFSTPAPLWTLLGPD